MSKNLVIVESPAKAKTIEKFLGKDFTVMSSFGHIRDLKKKAFSIEIENGYAPIYEIPSDKKELVKQLKKAAKESEIVWLASDEDREGEAIAWHLYEVLGLNKDNTKRIVFHEITKNAILKAIESPREIDIDRVDAQQARRILDRIVGFELSPVLWKKIKPALSAGRVQSVAVRLIVDRENEIKRFIAEQYYRVVGEFRNSNGNLIKGELNQRISSQESAKELLEACKQGAFNVSAVNVKPAKKSPAAPFTTSTLQQEASRKLGFTVAQTMMVAQKLYELGHITYMRTDSVTLSSLAIGTISDEIVNSMGQEYLKVRQYQNKSKGAQEAHEAIRPTYIDKHDVPGTAQEKRLYSLIWKRTIASQMSDAQLEKTTIDITIPNRTEKFVAMGEVIKFDGFLRVYIESVEDETEASQDSTLLPEIKVGERFSYDSISAIQRFTQQPARYSEASLVKKLEELGIGRPSTYAPTISTVQNREYVVKGEELGQPRNYELLKLVAGDIQQETKSETVGSEKGKLLPTDIGTVVNDFLIEYFPLIMDYNFTANVEQQFDEVANGDIKWNQVIGKFYDIFHPDVDKTSNLRLERKVGERILGIDPKSGKEISVKIGRFGPLVQLGSTDTEEKPQFASLQKGQSVSTITLEEAIKLFDLPRTVGEFEGADVVIAVGRFGPYIKHASKFVSIPKDYSPQSITLEESIALIEAKRVAEANRVVRKFDSNPDLEILNGRYGVYIAYKKSNYKIPKGVEGATLSEEECMEIIAKEDASPKKTRRKVAATKSTTKAAPKKRATAKKTTSKTTKE
ncbi:MAG: type I DNA topoisomerase [Bacteroidales bacterium]